MAKILTHQELREEEWRIREIFFKAMCAGYAAERAPELQELAVFPNSKHFEYETGLWRVVDTWHVSPVSDYSGGTTIIYYREMPIWMMQYFGEYPKSAIPILRAALRAAYTENVFWGGRGADGFKHSDGRYLNFLDPEYRTFERFRGTEIVLVTESDDTGSHFYHGGLMI